MERPKPGETYYTLSPAEAREVALSALYETAVNWLWLTSQARSYFRQNPEALHGELDRLVESGKTSLRVAERLKLQFPIIGED